MALGQYIRLLAVVGVFFVVGAALPVGATPLDKESCDKLKAEKQSLTTLGVEKDMAKGPEWAKSNMKPAQLDLVKRYITVEEQIKFRCHTAIAAHGHAKVAKKAKGAAATKPEAKADDKGEQPAAKGQVAGADAAKSQVKKADGKKALAVEAPDDKEQE